MNEKEDNNIKTNSIKSSSNNLNIIDIKIDKILFEEYLKCPKCNVLYDTDLHSPFVIKCGHSFCKQCIMNNNNDKCPIDNISNSFELYIKNIQLEILINKFLYNFSKTMPIKKQMIYTKNKYIIQIKNGMN